MSPQEKNPKGENFEEENPGDYWKNWIKGKESCDEYITLLKLFPKDEKSKDSSVYCIQEVIGRLKDEAQNEGEENILKNLTMNLVDKVEK